MRLYLMRHGQAESGMDNDASRVLTPTGHTQNCAVARQWNGRLERMPECFCSPYLRAQQTAEDLQSIIPGLKFQSSDWLLPSTPAATLFVELAAIAGEGVRSDGNGNGNEINEPDILLVGHNPILSEVWNLLSHEEGDLRLGLSTSHLVCIDTPVVAPACGSFVYTVTP